MKSEKVVGSPLKPTAKDVGRLAVDPGCVVVKIHTPSFCGPVGMRPLSKIVSGWRPSQEQLLRYRAEHVARAAACNCLPFETAQNDDRQAGILLHEKAGGGCDFVGKRR